MVDLRLVRIPEHNFIHGGCLLNGTLTTLIYFEDTCQGMMCLAKSPTRGEVLYTRFSGQALAKPRPIPDPSPN
jgi:hypothetical protein